MTKLIDDTKEKWCFLHSYVVIWWTTPLPNYDSSEWEGWSNPHEYVNDNVAIMKNK